MASIMGTGELTKEEQAELDALNGGGVSLSASEQSELDELNGVKKKVETVSKEQPTKSPDLSVDQGVSASQSPSTDRYSPFEKSIQAGISGTPEEKVTASSVEGKVPQVSPTDLQPSGQLEYLEGGTKKEFGLAAKQAKGKPEVDKLNTEKDELSKQLQPVVEAYNYWGGLHEKLGKDILNSTIDPNSPEALQRLDDFTAAGKEAQKYQQSAQELQTKKLDKQSEINAKGYQWGIEPELLLSKLETPSETSYVGGTIKAIDQSGIDVVKGLEGALTLLEKGGNFLKYGEAVSDSEGKKKPSDVMQENNKAWLDAPDNFMGNLAKGMGGMTYDLVLMGLAPEIKLGMMKNANNAITTIPKFGTYLGIKGAATAAGKPDADFRKIFDEGLLGVTEGTLMHGMGYTGGKIGDMVANAAKSPVLNKVAGATATSLIFGTHAGYESYLHNGEIDWKAVQQGLGMGAAFGLLPVAEAVYKRATDNFMTTPLKTINDAVKSGKSAAEVRDKSIDLIEKAADAEGEKKQETQLAATIATNTADVIAVGEQIKADPKSFINDIQNNPDLTPEEKKVYTDKINNFVNDNHPETIAAKPYLDKINQLQGEIKDIEGQNLSNPAAKELRIAKLKEEIKVQQNLALGKPEKKAEEKGQEPSGQDLSKEEVKPETAIEEVIYHGTTKKFDKLKASEDIENPEYVSENGVHFNSTEQGAQRFGATVIKKSLKGLNILDASDKTRFQFVVDWLVKNKRKTREEAVDMARNEATFKVVNDLVLDRFGIEGYDGIKLENEYHDGSKDYWITKEGLDKMEEVKPEDISQPKAGSVGAVGEVKTLQKNGKLGSKEDTIWQQDPIKIQQEYRDAVDKYKESESDDNGKLMDDASKKRREYQASVRAAYSAGNISEAEIKNIQSKTPDLRIDIGDLKPVGGKEVYHLSVSASDVENGGFLTKDELLKKGGKEGLGGGRGGISLTWDKQYAERLFRIFNEIKDALNGKVNIADEFKKLSTKAQGQIVDAMKSAIGGKSDDIRNAIENNKTTYNREKFDAFKGFTNEEIKHSSFIKHYYNALSLFSDLGDREWVALHTGIEKLKDADIGIFKGTTKKNAHGEILPAEREYHVFSGDAVENLERITPKAVEQSLKAQPKEESKPTSEKEQQVGKEAAEPVAVTEKPVGVKSEKGIAAEKKAAKAKDVAMRKERDKETKEKRKAILKSEPDTIRQMIMKTFALGERIHSEDFKNETGFGARGERGKVRGYKEFQKRIWAHSGKGTRIDDMVMKIQEAWNTDHGEVTDQQSIRDEIISVLNDYDTKSQIETALEKDFSANGKVIINKAERGALRNEEDLARRYTPNSDEEQRQMEAWENMNSADKELVQKDDQLAQELSHAFEMTDEEAQKLLDNETEFNNFIKQEHENTNTPSAISPETGEKRTQKTAGQVKAEQEYETELANIEQKLKDAEKAKRDKLDRISNKVDLFAEEANKEQLLGAEQNLSPENIAKQLKPESDKIAKLEKEKADFEANRENYLKKYDNQSEITPTISKTETVEKPLTEKEKAIEAARAKTATALDRIATKLGSKKSFTEEERTSYFEDLKLAAEGISEELGIRLSAAYDILKEKVDKILHPLLTELKFERLDEIAEEIQKGNFNKEIQAERKAIFADIKVKTINDNFKKITDKLVQEGIIEKRKKEEFKDDPKPCP